VAAATDVLRDRQADVLVGFGGFVSAPAYLAAHRLRVPIVVHEANPRPGWANRLGARLTPYVATTFPGTPIAHGRHLGLPIRRTIATLDRAATRDEARRTYALDPDRPTLLVTGGSQGAKRLNDAASGAAAELRAAGVQVLHATGSAHVVEVPPGEPPYVVLPYLDRMELAYAAADLVLCRAGANTVVELTAVGLPAAYVPLPIGNGEQELIARPVVEAGGGLLVDDRDCTAAWVAGTLTPLLTDPERLATMGRAAASSGRRDADERLVDLALEAIESGTSSRGGRRW
jgi:UDP-N-acetylglucosamine--N-acetylmuramyl-(pentapeptide) pyrophosphoryl-undecaprenol N-acetylglucosamine transferase